MRAFIWAFLLCNFGFAQTITVRVIDGKDGHPLVRQPVSTQFTKSDKGFLPAVLAETDNNGYARFSVPEPMPEHVSVRVGLDYKYWHCACWLMTDMQKVVQTGAVIPSPQASSSKSTSKVASEPGEIVFEARAATFFERLLYPLTKE